MERMSYFLGGCQKLAQSLMRYFRKLSRKALLHPIFLEPMQISSFKWLRYCEVLKISGAQQIHVFFA